MFDQAEREQLKLDRRAAEAEGKRAAEAKNKRRREVAQARKARRDAAYALVAKPGALAKSQAPKKRRGGPRSKTAGNFGQGSKWISRATRLRIYARDEWRCVWCGVHVLDGRTLRESSACDARLATLDHFLTRSRGGTNRPANLVTSCMQCNHDRDHLSALAWAAKLQAQHHDDPPTLGCFFELSTILERALRALEKALPSHGT